MEKPNGIPYSIFDVVLSITDVMNQFESKANNIWVVSRDLNTDINNSEVNEQIESNYKRGVLYHYFLPESNGSTNQEIKYRKLFEQHIGKFGFNHLESSAFYFVNEIVIYDKKYCFQLYEINSEEKIYIKLSKSISTDIVDRLNGYIDKFDDLKALIGNYLNDPDIKQSHFVFDVLEKYYNNPVLLNTKSRYLKFKNRVLQNRTTKNTITKLCEEIENLKIIADV